MKKFAAMTSINLFCLVYAGFSLTPFLLAKKAAVGFVKKQIAPIQELDFTTFTHYECE